jgi:hypothetical protein
MNLILKEELFVAVFIARQRSDIELLVMQPNLEITSLSTARLCLQVFEIRSTVKTDSFALLKTIAKGKKSDD